MDVCTCRDCKAWNGEPSVFPDFKLLSSIFVPEVLGIILSYQYGEIHTEDIIAKVGTLTEIEQVGTVLWSPGHSSIRDVVRHYSFRIENWYYLDIMSRLNGKYQMYNQLVGTMRRHELFFHAYIKQKKHMDDEYANHPVGVFLGWQQLINQAN